MCLYIYQAQSTFDYIEVSSRKVGKTKIASILQYGRGLVVVGIRFTPGVVSSFNDSIAWDNTSLAILSTCRVREGDRERDRKKQSTRVVESRPCGLAFLFSPLTSWVIFKMSKRGHGLKRLHWLGGGEAGVFW